MKTKIFFRLGGLTALLFLLFLSGIYFIETDTPYQTPSRAEAAGAPSAQTSFHYMFSSPGVLQETGTMEESSSPYFWLNSGGELHIENGVGKTIQGILPNLNKWRLLYAVSNSLDTATGYLPQNLFRLVTKSSWENVEASIRFKLTHFNMTETPNRDGWSGVLLMSRYHDENNLYYAGVRMDGTAVIKKKYKGIYYTLAEARVFSSEATFSRNTNPNLIPGNIWMGMRSTTYTNTDGSVTIELWLDRTDRNNWEKILSATDKPGVYGKEVITGTAFAGIRTDYLNVFFDDYRLIEQN